MPWLRELYDEASIAVNPDGGFADFAAQHSEFIARLVVLSARLTERLLQESLKLFWPRMAESRCKNFAGMVCGAISHYRSVSRRTTTGEKLPVGSVQYSRKLTSFDV